MTDEIDVKSLKPGDADKIQPKHLEQILPSDVAGYFQENDGAQRFLRYLKETYKPEQIVQLTGQPQPIDQRIWECVGLHYIFKERPQPHDAFRIFLELYYQMLSYQETNDTWVPKGMPLVWIYECFSRMDFPALAKRYLMLTLCEEAIKYEGNIPPESGAYFRLVWQAGLTDSELKQYSKEIFEFWEVNPAKCYFPEWILQKLDHNWLVEYPSNREMSYYVANSMYIEKLSSELGEGTGKTLEKLARYIVSCIPGCRTHLRETSFSTDYDIVCTLEGQNLDFRAELGRYFVCECKDWARKVGFPEIAKFCRVLDSVKCRFGIIFSKNGISGKGKATNAEREQIKVFQDRGMVIVDFDKKDLNAIESGVNFISLLREKYEKVRLDLRN